MTIAVQETFETSCRIEGKRNCAPLPAGQDAANKKEADAESGSCAVAGRGENSVQSAAAEGGTKSRRQQKPVLQQRKPVLEHYQELERQYPNQSQEQQMLQWEALEEALMSGGVPDFSKWEAETERQQQLQEESQQQQLQKGVKFGGGRDS